MNKVITGRAVTGAAQAGRHRMSLLTVGADQGRKIRRILDELSLEIAPPHEARSMLGLKGRAACAYRS